jgi:hypothetical protein
VIWWVGDKVLGNDEVEFVGGGNGDMGIGDAGWLGGVVWGETYKV